MEDHFLIFLYHKAVARFYVNFPGVLVMNMAELGSEWLFWLKTFDIGRDWSRLVSRGDMATDTTGSSNHARIMHIMNQCYVGLLRSPVMINHQYSHIVSHYHRHQL